MAGVGVSGFWDGRRVLVTGHTGFKGSWLSLWLASRGARVTGYSRGLPSSPCVFVLARVGELVESVEGDIRDAGAVAGAAADAEVVFHLAAQPIVRVSYERPYETFETNVIGTAAVLDAARRSDSVRVVVNVTSDKVYADRGWPWPYRERDRLGGHDPYSASKACSELVTDAYRASFLSARAVSTARAGNVFGGGDFAVDRLIPDAMRAAAGGHALEVRNPNAVRPWQHVLNALDGYLLLAERTWDDASLADAWNFGPAQEDMRPVEWIADHICSLWDGLSWHAAPQQEAPKETRALRVDSSKSSAELGWAARWHLDAGLERTVEWHRSLQRGEDMREPTLSQIADFERR